MVNPGQPQELANAIITILQDPQSIITFGQNARTTIENYLEIYCLSLCNFQKIFKFLKKVSYYD